MSKSRRVPLPGFIRVTGIRLRETQTGLGRTPCPVGEGPYMEQPLPRQWLFFESFPVVGPDRSGPFRSRDEAMRRQRTLDPCRPEASSLSKTKPASRLLHQAIHPAMPAAGPTRLNFQRIQRLGPRASSLEGAIWSERADPSTPGLGKNAAPAKFPPAAILNAGLTPLP